MINQKPEDILFSYLRDIIYAPEHASIDLTQLPEQYQDLGEGLKVLATFVLEQKKFADTLLAGDFENNIPSRENGIAAPLKEVHAILKHVVWQTAEVAKGDYNQKLEYFGEFSDSFNTMVKELKDREDNLKRKNQELEELQTLFKDITIDAPYRIIAINNDDHSISYLNTRAQNTKDNNPKLFDCFYQYLLTLREKATIFTIDDPEILLSVHHYRIISASDYLNDDKLIYVIYDVSSEILQEEALSQLAYHDELTGLPNRRYAINLANELYDKNQEFCIAFVDIDHLKYCNDVFGHEKGDEYIIEIARCLESLSPQRNVSRIGGDEFMVIALDCTIEEFSKDMETLYETFVNDHLQPFEKSFSYGLSEYSKDNPMDLTDVLSLADQRMYEFKLRNKKEISYQDNRM